jgi:hypothetical protein
VWGIESELTCGVLGIRSVDQIDFIHTFRIHFLQLRIDLRVAKGSLNLEGSGNIDKGICMLCR